MFSDHYVLPLYPFLQFSSCYITLRYITLRHFTLRYFTPAISLSPISLPLFHSRYFTPRYFTPCYFIPRYFSSNYFPPVFSPSLNYPFVMACPVIPFSAYSFSALSLSSFPLPVIFFRATFLSAILLSSSQKIPLFYSHLHFSSQKTALNIFPLPNPSEISSPIFRHLACNSHQTRNNSKPSLTIHKCGSIPHLSSADISIRARLLNNAPPHLIKAHGLTSYQQRYRFFSARCCCYVCFWRLSPAPSAYITCKGRKFSPFLAKMKFQGAQNNMIQFSSTNNPSDFSRILINEHNWLLINSTESKKLTDIIQTHRWIRQ